MRRTIILSLGLLLLLAPTGCKLKKAIDEAKDVAANLEDVGTTELLEKTADDSYEAPADGRLTEGQIEMYLKVREHEKKIVQVARQELEQHAKKAEASGEKSIAGMVSGFKALGSVADAFTADVRAAHELGFNTAEYQWVKEQVLEASGAAFQDTMQQSMNAMMEQSVAELRKQHDEATEPEHKKVLASMLADTEKGVKEMRASQEQVEPSTAYNRQLLSKYENTLNALAQEFAKWESNPGDAEKALQEWQAKTEAQTGGQ